MLDYKNYDASGWAVSSDEDAVGVLMQNKTITTYTAPTKSDLLGAAEWLATYQVMDDLELAQSLANVIAFLDLHAQAKIKRNAINEMKRQYAKENGLKFRQVRVVKK